MRVLVAGATGVIGRHLTPLLVSVGHEVFGLTRPNAPHGRVEEFGGTSIEGDLLDANTVLAAAREVRPDAVVHMATAIARDLNPRKMSEEFAVTNRLRTEGTRNLLRAAADVGTQRVVAQSVAFGYEPGPGLADETAPLFQNPSRDFAPLQQALLDLERQTIDAGGVALRFGHLYGPGTSFAADGPLTASVKAGKVPLVGHGTAVFSFTHCHDAATAVVAALDRPVTGVLNVVDDDPTPVAEWLPAMARLVHGPRPKSLPAWLARPVAGSWGVTYFTRLRGASNARAKVELDWKPRYSSWRDGFAEELAEHAA
jgi:nucleoside-diphosphate-sugar epimerase